jgi:hypothetical protein
VSNADDQQTRVRIRRAPKFSVFIILGAVIGVLATLVLTSLFPADPSVGFGPLFGYFAIYGVTAGVLVGAIVALIADRVSSRRAKTVVATIGRLQPDDPEAEREPEEEAGLESQDEPRSD